MTIARLSDDERRTALAALTLWTYVPERDAITRTLTFDSFIDAFAAMTRIALLSEKADHHPEWSNVYGRIDILLSTHDAGGLSRRDIALARQIDDSLASRPVPLGT